MAISPVSASNGAVTATQAIKPQQQTDEVQRARSESSSQSKNVEPQAPPPPKPSVNTSGQTVGTIVNVTA